MNVLDQIKEAKDRRTVILPIKEWGLTLTLHEPAMGEVKDLRDTYLILEKDGKPNLSKSRLDDFNWALLALCLFDEVGGKLFENGKQAMEVLTTKSHLVVSKLIEECGTLTSPISDEEVEEAIKN